MIDETRFRVLNAIYLRKLAPVAHIAAVTGISESEVQNILTEELSAGGVDDMGGSFMLQPDGTAKVLAFYSEAYADLRKDPDVTGWYERFEVINAQFIKAVSEWQTSDGDARAQERMVRIVEKMIRNLGEIAPRIPRYQGYADRFERSMAAADRGEKDFVCNPTVDSMHNIWFEFHEDILAVIGRPRDV